MASAYVINNKFVVVMINWLYISRRYTHDKPGRGPGDEGAPRDGVIIDTPVLNDAHLTCLWISGCAQSVKTPSTKQVLEL